MRDIATIIKRTNSCLCVAIILNEIAHGLSQLNRHNFKVTTSLYGSTPEVIQTAADSFSLQYKETMIDQRFACIEVIQHEFRKV